MSEQARARTVGVMGGLGPEATLDFFSKVLRRTCVTHEQDHVHLLIDNNPRVPDRNRSIAGLGPSSAPALMEMAARLQNAGAGLIVMPCNTAHAYEQEIRSVLQVPFLSIVETACDAALTLHPGARRIGVLAAEGCRRAGLYERELKRRDREVVVPDADRQLQFMQLVYRVKAGSIDADTRARMVRIARCLRDVGADIIIAACTEAPLVLSPQDLDVPLIDSTESLAERCIQWAGARLRSP